MYIFLFWKVSWFVSRLRIMMIKNTCVLFNCFFSRRIYSQTCRLFFLHQGVHRQLFFVGIRDFSGNHLLSTGLIFLGLICWDYRSVIAPLLSITNKRAWNLVRNSKNVISFSDCVIQRLVCCFHLCSFRMLLVAWFFWSQSVAKHFAPLFFVLFGTYSTGNIFFELNSVWYFQILWKLIDRTVTSEISY